MVSSADISAGIEILNNFTQKCIIPLNKNWTTIYWNMSKQIDMPHFWYEARGVYEADENQKELFFGFHLWF